MLEQCMLCPRSCGVNRLAGQRGRCHENAAAEISRASLHMWEEPPISGSHGSGTVFFAGCPLGCVFCQNHIIADGSNGQPVSNAQLAEVFLKLQDMGANNINLVTPTHFVPQIAEVLRHLKLEEKSLRIPVIYNTGSYETVETLRMLGGLVDIYLPDLKYFAPAVSEKYARAADYFDTAAAAIAEMYAQVGAPKFYTSPSGDVNMMRRGLIIRHLILPSHTDDSKRILRYIYETYRDNVIVSIMNQYTPLHLEQLKDFPELQRRVTDEEYDEVVDYALELGMENAFVQEGEAASESFIPDFENFDLEKFLLGK